MGSTNVQSDGLPNRGFIGQLSPGLTAELIEGAPSVYYPEGSIIFSAGSGTTAALVVSGLLRYYMAGSDGRELTVRYVGPGDLVGALIMEQSSLSTRTQAIRPSVLLHLDVDRVQALAVRRPELSQALINELSNRLRFAFRALAASAFMPVRARVARDLVERAKMLGPLEAGVHLAVTQQSLADATGSVREVVARALRELRRGGAIATVDDGITILDPDALNRIAAV
jgi:CRP/FNR family transcriptional regulator